MKLINSTLQLFGSINRKVEFSCNVCILPVSCGRPITPGNGSIDTYQSILEGTEIFFKCNPGFVPAGKTRAVCTSDGRWNPDPAGLVCTGEVFQVQVITVGQYYIGAHSTTKMGGEKT